MIKVLIYTYGKSQFQLNWNFQTRIFNSKVHRRSHSTIPQKVESQTRYIDRTLYL